MATQVRAIAPGYDGNLRAIGDVFDCPKGKDPKSGKMVEVEALWYVPVGKDMPKDSDGDGDLVN